MGPVTNVVTLTNVLLEDTTNLLKDSSHETSKGWFNKAERVAGASAQQAHRLLDAARLRAGEGASQRAAARPAAGRVREAGDQNPVARNPCKQTQHPNHTASHCQTLIETG